MPKFCVFLFFLFSFSLAFSSANAGECTVNPDAPAYQNARFGFSLSWTPGHYTVFEADNGDGITVTDGKGLTMQAYAALDPRVDDISREQFFAKGTNHPHAQYKRINRQQGWYVLSYEENGTIFYTKQYYHKDHWPTLHFEYPKAMQKKYGKLVDKAVSTFRPF